MDACTFDSFVNQIPYLSSSQCARVLSLLKEAIGKVRTVAVLEAAVAGRLHRPHCNGTSLYRMA